MVVARPFRNRELMDLPARLERPADPAQSMVELAQYADRLTEEIGRLATHHLDEVRGVNDAATADLHALAQGTISEAAALDERLQDQIQTAMQGHLMPPVALAQQLGDQITPPWQLPAPPAGLVNPTAHLQPAGPAIPDWLAAIPPELIDFSNPQGLQCATGPFFRGKWPDGQWYNCSPPPGYGPGQSPPQNQAPATGLVMPLVSSPQQIPQGPPTGSFPASGPVQVPGTPPFLAQQPPAGPAQIGGMAGPPIATYPPFSQGFPGYGLTPIGGPTQGRPGSQISLPGPVGSQPFTSNRPAGPMAGTIRICSDATWCVYLPLEALPEFHPVIRDQLLVDQRLYPTGEKDMLDQSPEPSTELERKDAWSS